MKENKETILGTVLVVSLLLGFASISRVPVNSVGVKYSNIRGTISEESLNSGIHFKMPFVDKITKVSTELRSADIDDMSITTQDAQAVTIDIELQYRVLPEDAIETFKQFRSTKEEDWINSFVFQRIQRGVQDASSKYTVIDLMGSERGAFQLDVDKAVAEALQYNHLSVHSVSVDDIQVSESMRASIEANSNAKQAVETARQKQLEKEVSNATAIAEAEADAKVKVLEAEAEAEANLKLVSGISPQLIEYIEAQARKTHGWYKYNNMNPTIVEDSKN